MGRAAFTKSFVERRSLSSSSFDLEDDDDDDDDIDDLKNANSNNINDFSRRKW